MADVNALVAQAINAYKAGRREEARNLLLEAVDQNEYHEEAWLWLSAVVGTLEEQKVCLENVLDINPNNERARKGLEKINQKLAARDNRPPDIPPAPKSAAPPRSSAPIGAEFAETSGDKLIDDSVPAGWDFLTGGQAATPPTESWQPFGDSAPIQEPDPFAPATSVDWVRDGPSVYGSGKQVELPSEHEYDDWLRSLNLPAGNTPPAPPSPPAEKPPATTSPFILDNSTPFGDTSFMVEPGLFDAPQEKPDQPGPFGDDLFTSKTLEAVPDPFATSEPFGSPDPFVSSGPFGPGDPFSGQEAESYPGTEPFSSLYQEERPAHVPAFEVDPALDAPTAESDLRFDFDDTEDDILPGDDFFGVSDESTVGSPKAGAAVNTADYFQYIPKEIEARRGGITGRSLLLVGGIAVLTILNVVAVIALLAA